MATTYPLSGLPASPGFVSFEMTLVTAAALQRSQFSFKGKGYWWGGEAWMIKIGLPAMRRIGVAGGRRSVEEWNSTLLKLDGPTGTINVGDMNARKPRGNATGGTPLVNGAGQDGEVLLTDGWTAGQYLLQGDYVQIASPVTAGAYGLHKLVEDAVADASGNMSLVLRPHIGLPGRTPYANNAAITVTNTVGTFRLAGGYSHGWSVDRLKNYGIGFTLIEDVQ